MSDDTLPQQQPGTPADTDASRMRRNLRPVPVKR